MNTEFDSKLINRHLLYGCIDLHSVSKYEKIDRKRFEESLIQVYHDTFPSGTSATEVTSVLETTGAQCQKVAHAKTKSISCKLKKEYIYGITGLHVLGWKIHRAILTVNSFEYLITTQEERILNVSVDIIESECFEMDKDLYEQSKTVKSIRRL
ncbi:MAG: hypothetical protein KAJ03_03525 [Gammaproteobacteria bacterium]|nr:hypothetical protein [Gammaproteobacteria bacterium]